MQRLQVRAERLDYPVVVGRGAWRQIRSLSPDGYSSTFIVTEGVIWSRWRELFRRESGLEKARVLLVPSGERSKSLVQVERLASQLLRYGADRRSLLILFGGGVIGDLGGFVASTYMRGIDCVQVPTTVLAQVDSSVGSKTGVNVGAMKNLLGTFYAPRMVLADPIVLGSLPPRVFRSGLYEMAKHAILSGPPLFDLFERELGNLAPQNSRALSKVVVPAVTVKVDVVNRDEREAGLRQTLNLGHTFGHALEEGTGYRRFRHGEAVGLGLLAVALLAERLGVMNPDGARGRRTGVGSDAERIRRLVRAIGPLPSIRNVPARTIVRLLPRDKKTVRGEIHWVIPERIGKVKITTGIPLAAAEAVWRELQQS
jgi:3-dehydroquinate synthase